MPVIFAWLAVNSAALADCPVDSQGELVEISFVYDGDTVKLKDGRKVRLIGINTPEIGGDGKPDEPGASAASGLLRQLVENNQDLLFMRLGTESSDRYQRILAHLYDRQGKSVTESLLLNGAGYTLTVPPNLKNQECFKQAELKARNGRVGVWRSPAILTDKIPNTGSEGFHLVRSRVVRVGKSSSAIWINLKNGLALRISRSDWPNFQGVNENKWVGKKLEARGWVYMKKGEHRMRVRHPASIEWLD